MARLDDFTGALRALEHAGELDPENPEVPLEAGAVLLELLRFEEAEQSLRRAMAIGTPGPRAHRDLVHIHDTFESLIYHHDRKGEDRLGRFAAAYMALHLDRMLGHKWQSKHPEVMGLDANLRLLKADILMKMRSEDRADRVIDDIRERYRGRESMLVDYPVGTQQSLADGLRVLQQ